MSEATPTPSMGPTSGLVYGDVPNRIIAYIIDIIVLAIINVVVGIVLAVVGISALSGTGLDATTNWVGSIILSPAVSLAISGAYFVYAWTNQRATIGMKALSLQIGNALRRDDDHQGIRPSAVGSPSARSSASPRS